MRDRHSVVRRVEVGEFRVGLVSLGGERGLGNGRWVAGVSLTRVPVGLRGRSRMRELKVVGRTVRRHALVREMIARELASIVVEARLPLTVTRWSPASRGAVVDVVVSATFWTLLLASLLLTLAASLRRE